MCYETVCSTCGKKTWGGCGMHANSVMSRIPEDQRCTCDKKVYPKYDPSASSLPIVPIVLLVVFLLMWLVPMFFPKSQQKVKTN